MNLFVLNKFNSLFLVILLSLSFSLSQEKAQANSISWSNLNNLSNSSYLSNSNYLNNLGLVRFAHHKAGNFDSPYPKNSNKFDFSSGDKVLFSSTADERGLISACNTWSILSGAQSERLSNDNKFFKIDPKKISLNYLMLVENYGINFSKQSKLAEIKNFILENKVHDKNLELNYLFSSNPNTIVHLRYQKSPTLELLSHHHEYLYRYSFNLEERVVLASPIALHDGKIYNLIVLTAMRDIDNSCLLRVLSRESKKRIN